MIGSHNIPPPPSNDGAFIAAVIGEPEIPLDGPPLGIDIDGIKDEGLAIQGTAPGVVDIGILAAKEIGGNPDIILEYSTGSIPEGTGFPEAAAAATISAGVGSKVPVITL